MREKVPHVNHFFFISFCSLSHFGSPTLPFFCSHADKPRRRTAGFPRRRRAERRRSHHALHTSPPPRSRRSKSQWMTRTAAGAFRRPSHRPPIVRHLLRKPVNQASSHAGLASRPRGRGPARQPPGARGTPLPNNTNAGVFAPWFSFCAGLFTFPMLHPMGKHV